MTSSPTPDRSFSKWMLVPILLGVVLLIMLPCAGLVWGIVLPGLSESREMADIRESQRRMRGIYQAMAIYAQNNDDLYPPADGWKETLIATGYAPAELLVSPVPDGDNEEYVWLPGETSHTRAGASSSRLVMYEDPDHHPQGVVVLFADGRSDVVDSARFYTLLKSATEP